jgi:hypothetical protein
MVIIATMIAKIYFPESLERGQTTSAHAPVTRSYSYRMVDAAASENESYYGSDVSDDEDEDNDEVLDSNDGSYEESDSEPMGRAAQIRNFMEFDQQTMSRSQVLKRLAFCSLMLNITFVMWGVLQVRCCSGFWNRTTEAQFRSHLSVHHTFRNEC